MDPRELALLLAIEPSWTVSVNGREFLTLPSSEIEISKDTIQFGKYRRRIFAMESRAANTLRIRAGTRTRSHLDILVFYPGDRLPSRTDLTRRRRAFQSQLAGALKRYFQTRLIERQTLYSDKVRGIGGAYPRFLLPGYAVIAADPEDTSAVVNGLMRAAILWSGSAETVGRRMVAVVPGERRQTTVTRLKALGRLRTGFDWLQWNGESLEPLDFDAPDPETYVHRYTAFRATEEVQRVLAMAPGLLQAVPDILQRSTSIRLRGIEVARVRESGTDYPLGTPLEPIVAELAEARRHGSAHPLARAHEERWLESNLIAQMRELLPSADLDHIYPQVPSFVGEERSIVDLLVRTQGGRLAVIEVKASADPDLPFQALDYWLAVERHRKAGDFEAAGYFRGAAILDEPAMLIVAAPLLAFHKTFDRLAAFFPKDLPMTQVGVDARWKQKIKILRRKGLLG